MTGPQAAGSKRVSESQLCHLPARSPWTNHSPSAGLLSGASVHARGQSHRPSPTRVHLKVSFSSAYPLLVFCHLNTLWFLLITPKTWRIIINKDSIFLPLPNLRRKPQKKTNHCLRYLTFVQWQEWGGGGGNCPVGRGRWFSSYLKYNPRRFTLDKLSSWWLTWMGRVLEWNFYSFVQVLSFPGYETRPPQGRFLRLIENNVTIPSPYLHFKAGGEISVLPFTLISLWYVS